MRLRVVWSVTVLGAFVACIDGPSFTLVVADAGTDASTPVTDADMALVPVTRLEVRADAGRCTPFPLLGITCDAGAPGATTVASFALDRRETTEAEYAACVGAGRCTAARANGGCKSEGPDHPVTCVTRAQAVAYCAWKTKRLVRSLEHVAAAAGNAGRTYPWGDEAPTPDRVNACGPECKSRGMYATADAWKTTAPPGALPPGQTPEGVLDLAGNVAEWVDGEPAGVRGGSYADTEPAAVSAAAVVTTGPETVSPTIGFRCARDPS